MLGLLLVPVEGTFVVRESAATAQPRPPDFVVASLVVDSSAAVRSSLLIFVPAMDAFRNAPGQK